MSHSWNGSPVAVTFLLLFGIVMLRGQGTYWLARSVTTGALAHTLPSRGLRARVHTWLQSRVQGRGTDAIERYGTVVIPIAHVTLGIQTLVLAAAGVLRIGWLRFSIAQAVGGLAWATIYTTIGFAVWNAALAAAAGNPWVLTIVLALVTLMAAYLTRRQRRAVQQRGGPNSVGGPCGGGGGNRTRVH